MKYYEHVASQFAGPVLHARALLGPEPILWAAFSEHTDIQERSASAFAKKLAAIPGKVATSVYDSLVYAEGDGMPETVDDVYVYYHPDRPLARNYCLEMSLRATLWVLTPHRMHVAERLDPPPPVDEFRPGEEPSPDDLWKPDNPYYSSAKKPSYKEQPERSRRKQLLYPLKPRVDIPREHIAGFEVDSDGAVKRRHFLRMQLVDGSGFEFFFGRWYPREYYEHLLALSHGTAE